MAASEPLHSFYFTQRTLREAARPLTFARTLARRAERRLVELAAEVNVRPVLMRYASTAYRTACTPRRAEDSVRTEANIIREVSKALSGCQPADATGDNARGPLIRSAPQLTRAAVERAQQLQVPVVVSIVDARHGNCDTADAGRPAGQQRTGAKGMDRSGSENGDP